MMDTEIYNRLMLAVDRLPRGKKLDHDVAARIVGMEPEALAARLKTMARLDPRVEMLLGNITLNNLAPVED